jgi:NAD-dependent deacetylase
MEIERFNINRFEKIFILTGSGVSVASGLSTFRGDDGLWEDHAIEDVATPKAFDYDPIKVWKFYSRRRQEIALARPNVTHHVLNDFINNFSGSVALVTQNVDGLHRRAASSSKALPLCMHGTLEESRCTGCGKVWIDDMIWLGSESPMSSGILMDSEKRLSNSITNYPLNRDWFGLPLSPCCMKLLRPNIVWFEEIPFEMDKILLSLSRCDLFISIGTSGTVYPAASFLCNAKKMVQ